MRRDGRPSEVLTISNPAKESAIPGGASVDVMQAYAFIPSHLFYPTPGCYEFTVKTGSEEVRIVVDRKPLIVRTRGQGEPSPPVAALDAAATLGAVAKVKYEIGRLSASSKCARCRAERVAPGGAAPPTAQAPLP